MNEIIKEYLESIGFTFIKEIGCGTRYFQKNITDVLSYEISTYDEEEKIIELTVEKWIYKKETRLSDCFTLFHGKITSADELKQIIECGILNVKSNGSDV